MAHIQRLVKLKKKTVNSGGARERENSAEVQLTITKMSGVWKQKNKWKSVI